MKSESLGIACMFAGFLPGALLRVWRDIRPHHPAGLFNPSVTVRLSEPFAERCCRIIASVGIASVGLLPMLGLPSLHVFPGYEYAFLAMGGYSLFATVFTTPIALELSEDGLRFNRITPSTILWGDIAGIQRKAVFPFPLVILDLITSDKYRMTRPRWRKRPCKRIGIPPVLFGLDSRALSQAIEHRLSLNAF
ncbi:hypothetical protein [Dongia sp.]|uniref:hypothetical protein n=1 Tax=Dongia sp. TaxID=1977262 RepID=UPI0037515C88